ncbi:MAG: ABC-F family ATP-binding cassette domain-containing protein [Cytophagales bacterium]|nr:ABC-F family ATP-binding cassette domain-containing protein [Cytophagales bacterium]MDW8385007.1 ABC-F family ATP-binding cassette domain-containing protein [Flammeovirgaceae bacterium]
MNILSIENLTKSFQENPLFENIQIGISRGEKIGLIGVNGSGKSTLLRLIVGEEKPDTGRIVIRQGIKVGFLEQEPIFEDHLTVWDAIFETTHPVLQAVKNYQRALRENQNIEQATAAMDALEAWNVEYKIKEILGKLGIHNTTSPVYTLSGGQRKRVALAKVLLKEPDFLILDEPTNHLDLDVIEWLEDYLSTSTLTLLVVSHDRYFLDKVTDVIWEIDQKRIFRYEGNYAFFLEARQARLENQQSQAEKAQKLFQKELEWLRRQPKARGTKAKYRIDAAQLLRQKSYDVAEEKRMDLSIKAQQQGKKILEVERLSKSFGDKIILRDFSYVFKKNEKIGIVGKNGTGKTTFLRLITQQILPDSGTINKGENTIFGYYSQEFISIPSEKRVIDVVKDIADFIDLGNGNKISASQFLSNFMFSMSKQYDYVSKLSGGEKRRLQLLLILAKNPNFLILDEPTNDLDIFTLTALEQYLSDFQGCLLIVSHDRYFMDRLADHLWIFEGNGLIRDFNGSYSEYRAQEVQKQKEKNLVIEPHKTITPKSKTSLKASYKERQEFLTLETQIAQLEQQKNDILIKMSNNKAATHQQLYEWAKEIQNIDSLLEEKTNRWLELSELDGIE